MSVHRLNLLAFCLLLLPTLGCRQQAAPAAGAVAPDTTLAIVNARIWTGNASQPWAEALAMTGERITLVGSNDQVRRAAGAARTIDAGGQLVVPGFIDTHVHFIEGGFRLASVQLRDASTREEFVSRIAAFAATVPEGAWITGGDWDHTLWGGELPSREWIDAVTPNHPVWINRLDGHMALANTAALKAAGVTRATKEIDGGEIVRDANGEPAGVLKDNAMSLVDAVVPAPSSRFQDRALAAAMKYVNEQGVTSVHNMGTRSDLETFSRAAKAKTLTTRIYAAVPLADWARLRDVVRDRTYGGNDGRGDEWLRIGALKGFVDGSLGSHTAAFYEPFDDAPRDKGLLVNTPADLYTWISGADKAGLHVMVHAIGDRANGLILDIYERVAKAYSLPGSAQNHQHSAEHSSAAMSAGLGEIDFPNSGASAAQSDFRRGVLLLHSFEFESAREAFLKAQRADPGFALAYWGEALSYNKPIWNEQNLPAARAALAKLAATAAQRIAKAPTQREKDYLASVEKLFGEGEKSERDAAYSAALGAMAKTYPEDLDARSLYALSLLALTGATRNTANYMRAAAEAEAVYEINKRHPGALHYLIHAYDDPVHAPLGLRAARLYGQVAPAAAHAQHMPSHIFFALGMWDDAIDANVASLKTARDQRTGGYHALLWLSYALLQQDRRDEAAKLVALVADDARKTRSVYSRSNLAFARATWLVETRGAGGPEMRADVDSAGITSIAFFSAYDFARGVVAANDGDTDAAGQALHSLQARIEAGRRPMAATTSSRYDTVTPEELRQSEIMATALAGAVRFAEGDRSGGIDRIRAAIASADSMVFEYGPPWSVKPLDELLGEMLLKQGDSDQAAAAFEKVLAAHPNRRLSLEGLARARAGG